MENYYIDFEFNSYKGAPISFGIYGSGGSSFYAIFEENSLANLCAKGITVDPWIVENVYDKLHLLPEIDLNKHMMVVGSTMAIQEALVKFLKKDIEQRKQTDQVVGSEIISFTSDWPDDIKYLSELLMTGPGTMVEIRTPITFNLYRVDAYPSTDQTLTQHNALSDAKALKLKMDQLVHELYTKLMSESQANNKE